MKNTTSDIKYANTFRLNYKKDKEKGYLLSIDFGEFIKNKDSNKKDVDIKAQVMLPVDLTLRLILNLIRLGQIFQEETGNNIGLPKHKKNRK